MLRRKDKYFLAESSSLGQEPTFKTLYSERERERERKKLKKTKKKKKQNKPTFYLI